MTLVHRRRTTESSEVRRDLSLVAKRAVVGTSFLGGAGALALTVGGWTWLLAGLLAIPGGFTLAALRQPFVAPCPGCSALLGNGLVNLPDEPVVGASMRDLRCHACGIYLDASGGTVREVAFSRELDGPGYELALDAEALDALTWADGCIRCQRDAVRFLTLAPTTNGVLSGLGAKLAETRPGEGFYVPYCGEHGEGDDPVSRGIVVARAGKRVVVQLSVYGVYRGFLDDNRDRVDVAVRSSALRDSSTT